MLANQLSEIFWWGEVVSRVAAAASPVVHRPNHRRVAARLHQSPSMENL
jgi:hypothetical protein